MKLKNIKTKIVQKIHDHTEYVLNTTKTERKRERKARRAFNRAERLGKLRTFKPFDWGFMRKLEVRLDKRSVKFNSPEPIKS